MYVIAGVSGNTGSVVARRLLEAKKSVRVIVRDTDKGEDWKKLGAEVSLGTLQDGDFLTQALRGAEAAYLLLPPNMTSGDIRKYQFETLELLAGAVEQSGLPRLVPLSSIGAHNESGTGPIDALGHLERKLQR